MKGQVLPLLENPHRGKQEFEVLGFQMQPHPTAGAADLKQVLVASKPVQKQEQGVFRVIKSQLVEFRRRLEVKFLEEQCLGLAGRLLRGESLLFSARAKCESCVSTTKGDPQQGSSKERQ